ncbi:hypothetical protein DJ031_04225 [bacterium endosymbiont of Escarpia laminata]|nr:MAG: hypothetical protein DJ031_04225 [bacterium endosymbiont of Escarpia laminata]
MAMLSSQSSSRSSWTRSSTTITTYECNICNATFNSRGEAEVHIKECHPEISKPLYVCSLCKQEFSSKKKAEEHIKRSHPETQIEVLRCPVCGKTYKQDAVAEILLHLSKEHPNEMAKMAQESVIGQGKNQSRPSPTKSWWKFWQK